MDKTLNYKSHITIKAIKNGETCSGSQDIHSNGKLNRYICISTTPIVSASTALGCGEQGNEGEGM